MSDNGIGVAGLAIGAVLAWQLGPTFVWWLFGIFLGYCFISGVISAVLAEIAPIKEKVLSLYRRYCL
jgi:hypothetical protein